MAAQSVTLKGTNGPLYPQTLSSLITDNNGNTLGSVLGYQCQGVASLSPLVPDVDQTNLWGTEKVYWIATQAGTYNNLGGLVVASGETALLTWNGIAWVKVVTGIATADQVSQLGQDVKKRNIHYDKFIFSANNVENGYYMNGAVTADSRWVHCTIAIPVRYKDVLTFDNPSDYAICYNGYDEDGTGTTDGSWRPDLLRRDFMILNPNTKYIYLSFTNQVALDVSTFKEVRMKIISSLPTIDFDIDNKSLYQGYWEATNGYPLIYSHSNWVAYKYVFPVKPNTTYYLDKRIYALGVVFLDKDYARLGTFGYNQVVTDNFTTPSNCRYVRIAFNDVNGVTPSTFTPLSFGSFAFSPRIYKSASLPNFTLSSSAHTLTIPAGVINIGNVVTNINSTTLTIDITGSANKYLVINNDNSMAVKKQEDLTALDNIIGWFILSGTSDDVVSSNLPFEYKVNNSVRSLGNGDRPQVRFSARGTNLPTIDTNQNVIIFPSDAYIIYSGSLYPIISGTGATQNNVPISMSSSISSLRVLVFNKMTHNTSVKAYDAVDYYNEYPIGWFNYDVANYPRLGGCYFDFPYSVNGTTDADVYNERYRDVIRLQSHMFMGYIGKTSADPIIPSQTIFEVQLCARLGIKSIEANVHKTATPGKYVVMHAGDPNYGDVGYQLVLKKSVYDADPTAFPIPEGEGLIPYGNDAYYYPWDNIPNTAYDRLRNSYFNRSIYPKYQVPITELTEFLNECKKYDITPIVSYCDDAMISLVESIMGKQYIVRSDKRHSNVMHIYWDNQFKTKTKEQIITLCNNIGKPFMYGLPTKDAAERTSSEVKDIIDSLHKLGYFVVFDGNYYSETYNQILKGYNVDGQTTEWDVPYFTNGSIVKAIGELDFSDFTTNGELEDGELVLENAEYVSLDNTSHSMFLGKELLEITFNGTLTISMGNVTGEFYSDGINSMLFTNRIFNGTGSNLSLVSSGTTHISNIIYKLDKV